MKYLCFLILFFCISCSPQISKYKVCEDCNTEQNALKVLDAYLINVKKRYENFDKKVEVYDFDNVYYLQYSPIIPSTEYAVRGCISFSIIIRKRDCKVLYFGANC